MTTPKNAQHAHCAALRARLRQALDFAQVPNVGFVARQIARHQESRTRQQSRVVYSSKIQDALRALEVIAGQQRPKPWSQRKLAAHIGISESTLRLIKVGRAMPEVWLPKLQAAATRLQPG